jgi:peptide deformylase
MKPKAAPLAIVPVADIPEAMDVPVDNLLSVFRTITQMEQLCTAQAGIGLSAVQVGIPWKLFIVQRGDGYEYYINCEYNGIGEKQKSIEGCLSLRDSQGNLRRFEVDRFSSIAVKGKQLKISSDSPSLVLDDVDRIEHGLYAVVFQHEIDHHSDVLISDIGTEVELTR